MIEPTYLRYVYDGLNNDSLNSENAASLPNGFIGLYDQEFNQKTSANEPKKILNQLRKDLSSLLNYKRMQENYGLFLGRILVLCFAVK